MSEVGDPFNEHGRIRARTHVNVLGGDFAVEAADAELESLVVEAFGGLPTHKLERAAPRFTVRVARTEQAQGWPRRSAPPRPALNAGAGFLCATVDAGNFAIVDVAMSRALVL